ncbi:hypothetical protein CCR97_14515 [Rhodoplanes elegans]|uniref:PIN domain-containing protein n=1 Tax=Rhodoplanes elegans TaxID=29408 RepID=A0A327KGE1_9BRAD|nr:PIN domain-containing protein [Rhodoplanes elegans]MBK5959411.1 hypothetical protein [Rhodoplanes elegans]RAI37819.1 hypothetical protein CH338_14795 [Rhodoplanes elegans]
MTEASRAPLVYLDANPFIYLIEGADDLVAVMERLFGKLQANPGSGATSELTLAEVLPKAPEWHREDYLDLMLSSGFLRLLPVTREVILGAAEFRRTVASAGFRMPKLPDAIHAVTAGIEGCRYLVTNDARLAVPTGVFRVGTDAASIAAVIEELP